MSLLPSLSSDDESPTKSGQQQEDDDSSEDEVDKSFVFGGILGEDGGFAPMPMENREWSYQAALQQIQPAGGSPSSAPPRMDVAALIKAKRKSFQSTKQPMTDNTKIDESYGEQCGKDSNSEGMNDTDDDDDGSSSSSSSDDSSDSLNDENDSLEEKDVIKTRTRNVDDPGKDAKDSGSEPEDEEEAAKAAAFYDNEQDEQQDDDIQVFAQLTLSRPLLRGVAAMGFVTPTPIQAAVIPRALAGRDVCASAVTGSGKTAAFLLPVLERLLHRYLGRTRALILTPTRELAAQCLGMMTTFAQFTKIRATLIVGGAKNVNAQAAELRTRPDIVVATPGRLLDHVTNSASVSLTDVECLVLDEADRLLDLGFQDEVQEIVKACPVQRQTLLFSATLNTKVDDLIQLSLKRPVRVKISDKHQTERTSVEVAPRLEQEFVRIRAGNEGVNREGILMALLTRTFTKRTIVFFDTKVVAHRLMILGGLMGLKCTELHGNLTQQQRLTALEDFRNGTVSVLLATDLAARGLDIDRVETVINFEMPTQIETYIHRIGRTARAGRGGGSCTLIGEGRRHLMKDLIKDAESKNGKKKNEPGKSSQLDRGVIRSRTVPPAVVAHFVTKIQSLEPHVKEVLHAEVVARMDRMAEMELTKAQNLIEHSSEIKSRPQREWFASESQKKLTKEAAAEKQRLIAEKVGTGMHRMTRKKRRAREAREALEAQDDDDDDDTGGEGAATNSKLSVNIKSSARAQKRQNAEKEKESANQSIRDQDLEMMKKAQNKKRKGRVTGTNALGDSTLFDEEKTSSRKPAKKEERARSSFEFRSYDPTKKLGKKKGAKKFKSRSKYKRK